MHLFIFFGFTSNIYINVDDVNLGIARISFSDFKLFFFVFKTTMKVIGIDGITNEYEYVKMGEFLVPIAEGRLLEKIFFRVLINSKKVFFESPQA